MNINFSSAVGAATAPAEAKAVYRFEWHKVKYKDCRRGCRVDVMIISWGCVK